MFCFGLVWFGLVWGFLGGVEVVSLLLFTSFRFLMVAFSNFEISHVNANVFFLFLSFYIKMKLITNIQYIVCYLSPPLLFTSSYTNSMLTSCLTRTFSN